MPRIADALERESRTVDLEQGDFERLLGRRERKQRNRRIRAGALGVIVALAIGAIFVRLADVGPDPGGSARCAPSGAGGSGRPRVLLRWRRLRRRSGWVERGQVADGRPEARVPGQLGEYWAEGSVWSPDGRYFAYRGTDCVGPGEGLVGRRVISDARATSSRRSPPRGWNIGWSPDSTRVAVWDGLFETIGVYGVDGDWQTQLTVPSGLPAGGDYDPQWTPDGTSLVVDASSSCRSTAARPGTPVGRGNLSPDGSHVAYVDRRSLTVARSDGSEPREVFGGLDRGPHLVSDRRSDRVHAQRRTTRPRRGDRIGDAADRSGARNVPRGHRVLTGGRPYPLRRTEDRGARGRCGASASTAPTPASSSPGRSMGTGSSPP